MEKQDGTPAFAFCSLVEKKRMLAGRRLSLNPQWLMSLFPRATIFIELFDPTKTARVPRLADVPWQAASVVFFQALLSSNAAIWGQERGYDKGANAFVLVQCRAML